MARKESVGPATSLNTNEKPPVKECGTGEEMGDTNTKTTYVGRLQWVPGNDSLGHR